MAHESLVKEGKTAIQKGIKPDEVEDYFLKKGMDKKEAHDAITKLHAEKVVQGKNTEAKKPAVTATAGQNSQNPKKSSFLFWLIIIIIGVIAYLFYNNTLSMDMLANLF